MRYIKRNRPFESIENETLVLATDQKSIIKLNITAREIWLNCNEKGLEEIVEYMKQKFLLPDNYYDELKKDCSEMLTYLIENGLVKVGD